MLARKNFLCCFILLCLLMLQWGCDGSSSSGSDDWHDDDDWYEDQPPPPNERVPPPNYTHDLMQYGPHFGTYGPAIDAITLGMENIELAQELMIGGEWHHIAGCQHEAKTVSARVMEAYLHETHAFNPGPASEIFNQQVISAFNRHEGWPGNLYAELLSINHSIAFYPQYVAIQNLPWDQRGDLTPNLYSDFREVFWPDCIQNIPTACFEPSYKFIDFEARCAEDRVKLSTLPGYEMLREAYIEIQNQTGVRLE